MVVSSGEEIPRGASLLARMVILSLEKSQSEIDTSTLTMFQELARAGKLAMITASFVQWLAPRMTELKTTFPNKVRDLRKEAIDKKFATSHSRSPDIYGNLCGAADIFIDFAINAGAITQRAGQEYFDQIEQALKDCLKAQNTYQKQSDEVEQFWNIFRACLLCGDVHLLNSYNQGPPKVNPWLWGWRSSTGSAVNENGDEINTELQAKGKPVGWIHEEKQELWLTPESVLQAVQTFAVKQGELLQIDKNTIFKRSRERGLIVEDELDSSSGGRRLYIKKTIGGAKRHRVMVFKTSLILGGGEDK
jgi:hypothetical protein